jgi:hypothetical protein
MKNNQDNGNIAATKGDLDKLEGKMEQLLADQVDVILEAVDEMMDKKMDRKLDPVINKLDGIIKGIEDLKQENTAGAAQLRRHDDKLKNHSVRIKKLEARVSR